MKDAQITGSSKRIAIAIDGPAGAGKSTLAKRVADELSYLHIDSGAMYRAATWIALEKGCDLNNQEQLTELLSATDIKMLPDQERAKVLVNGVDVSLAIRSAEVTRAVSTVSAVGSVRKILVEKQQRLADAGGVVMDGRDIGTVVLPEAELKIFLTASPEVRARRRLDELKGMGQSADLDTIIADIRQRDYQDSTRTNSPLKQADDAILVDTDNHTQEQVCQAVLQLFQQIIIK